MVTNRRNLLLFVVILAVAGVCAEPDVPDVNVEGLLGDVLLVGKRDKRSAFLGYGIGLGKGLVLGKAAGLALGKHFAGNPGPGFVPGGGYENYPIGGFNNYPQFRFGFTPQNDDYYEYPVGGYYGGGYGGASGPVSANSRASTTTLTGGVGPFHASLIKSDASASGYGR